VGCISTIATIKGGKINATASLLSSITTSAAIISSGVNAAPCPLILCVDGGAASTTSYPPINGLLNGGSS